MIFINLKRFRSLGFAIMPMLISMPAAATDQDDFCSKWRSVYDTAFRGFAPWRGAYSRDNEHYLTTIKFDGADSCHIEDSEFSHEFYCWWKYEHGQDMQSAQDALALSTAVRACIGQPPPSPRVATQLPRDMPSTRSPRKSVMVWTDRIMDESKNIETGISVIRSESYMIGRFNQPASQSLSVSISIDK